MRQWSRSPAKTETLQRKMKYGRDAAASSTSRSISLRSRACPMSMPRSSRRLQVAVAYNDCVENKRHARCAEDADRAASSRDVKIDLMQDTCCRRQCRKEFFSTARHLTSVGLIEAAQRSPGGTTQSLSSYQSRLLLPAMLTFLDPILFSS